MTEEPPPEHDRGGIAWRHTGRAMEDNGRYLIKNVRIVKPLRILEGDLGIENGVISYIGEPVRQTAGYHVIDGRDGFAVPGFIDIHCHGGELFDVSQGLYDPATQTFDDSDAACEEGLRRLLVSLGSQGTTRVVLATVAAPLEKLEHTLRCAGRFIRGKENGTNGAYLHGIFVEGTFIRYAEYAGAQNPDNFIAPSVEVFERLNTAAQGTVAYVNIVPEHGEAAYPLMAHLLNKGVLIGAGHTDATAEQYFEAVRKGLRVAIHFTNGPTGSSLKPFGGGGVLQAVLGSRRVYAELIADGYHVSPAYILDIIRRKGRDRIVGITDAMFVTGAGSVSEFEVAGIRGRRSADGQYLEVVGKHRTLFGSMLTMPVAFGNFVSWMTGPMPGIWNDVHDPLDLDEAVLATSRFCSVNAARAMGIFDPPNQKLGQDISMYSGGIQVGKRADVALIRLEGEPGAYGVRTDHVFVKGRRIK